MAWYMMPVFLITGWMLWHYHETGWFLFSPDAAFEANQKIVFTPLIMFRKSMFVLWHIVDFGRVFIWLFIVGCSIYFIKKRKKLPILNILLLFIITPLIVYMITFSSIAGHIGHRYYLNIFLFSFILLCFLLQQINLKKKIIYGLMIFFCVGLVTGNFWLYGAGFSNGWDTSLKVLPYFHSMNEMSSFVKEQRINPEEIGTKFPLCQDVKYTYLTTESFHFADMDAASIENFQYILLSNMSNQFTVKEKNTLNAKWVLIKKFSRGQVYLRLFKNPN